MPGASGSDMTMAMWLGGSMLVIAATVLIGTLLCVILAAVRRGRVTLTSRIGKVHFQIDLDISAQPAADQASSVERRADGSDGACCDD